MFEAGEKLRQRVIETLKAIDELSHVVRGYHKYYYTICDKTAVVTGLDSAQLTVLIFEEGYEVGSEAVYLPVEALLDPEKYLNTLRVKWQEEVNAKNAKTREQMLREFEALRKELFPE